MTRAARRVAHRWGMDAETRAAWFLRFKGYRIVGRRVRTNVGEIDLVAKRGRVLAIVEVKARSDLRTGLEAVSPRQQARISRAAEAYLAKRPELLRATIRFDVIVIVPGRPPRHVPDAWRPSS